ncbi:lysozyme RrrD-like [Clytia hemisphaerica]|uniref:Lysozyme n=1 Tax=Clytia hemisphaerica TaxID=252671 RepID=A0A7M5WWG7_9CNID|eukprot:TCONS_00049803-protein
MQILVKILPFLFLVTQQAQGKSISQAGLDLIKRFEGLRLTAYQDAVGVWTIGYGHTKGVRAGQTITAEQAELFLRQDVRSAENDVEKSVKVWINQNQYDALVSWTFNLGGTNLRKSTMLKKLNAGDFDRVPCEMIRWVYAGGKKLPGLVKRRYAEATLFNDGPFFC